MQDPPPLPQDDPAPPVEDVPDEMPDDRDALRQDAPGEEGPPQQAGGDGTSGGPASGFG